MFLIISDWYQAFCWSVAFGSLGAASPAPSTAGVKAHPRTGCTSVTAKAKQRVTVYAAFPRHSPPESCVQADLEDFVFVSDFPMSGSLLGAARCPQTLTSPPKHARALPPPAQSKSSTSSTPGSPCVCCSAPFRACRKPRRCQGSCLHPASGTASYPSV